MLAEKDVCTGCGVCETVCKHGAIKMVEDRLGFLYPKIQEERCVHCGQCQKHCPVINQIQTKKDIEKIAYTGHLLDEKELEECASGGFVTALYRAFIRMNNGIVYGTKWVNNFRRVIYTSTDRIEGISEFKNSKYIPSIISREIYEEIRSNLAYGKQILFVGLPCQIRALRNYLVNDYSNLLTCELICMGLSTPLVHNACINDMEKGHNGELIEFSFKAWSEEEKQTCLRYRMKMKEDGNNRDLYVKYDKSEWNSGFYTLKRESCFRCISKMNETCADITVGDYIGADTNARWYSPKGNSIIFPHTEKGLEWIRKLNDFEMVEVDYNSAVGAQGCLFQSYTKPPFFDEYKKKLLEDGLKSATELYYYYAENGIEEIIRKARSKMKKDTFTYAIWGCGKSFNQTYNAIQSVFPEAKLKHVIDKFKTGTIEGLRIEKPECLDDTIDHVFISTKMGVEDAVIALSKIYGNRSEEHYTKSFI